jgi:SAM-dependent methyltransferase
VTPDRDQGIGQAAGRSWSLRRLNKLCELEDWQDQELVATMRRVLPYLAQSHPRWPQGGEHRKHWEYAHALNGLAHLGVLHPDAFVLSVAAGHEEPIYDLTNRVRWVFAVDIYGQGLFAGDEAQGTMLTNPDAYARCPHNRNRLVVQHMNALDLRFEDGTFDVVFCLSSVEHFGGLPAATQALREMHRVLRTGGVALITTECIVNEAPELELENLSLWAPHSVRTLAASVLLRLV